MNEAEGHVVLMLRRNCPAQAKKLLWPDWECSDLPNSVIPTQLCHPDRNRSSQSDDLWRLRRNRRHDSEKERQADSAQPQSPTRLRNKLRTEN